MPWQSDAGTRRPTCHKALITYVAGFSLALGAGVGADRPGGYLFPAGKPGDEERTWEANQQSLEVFGEMEAGGT